jgi:hypothetical protein
MQLIQANKANVDKSVQAQRLIGVWLKTPWPKRKPIKLVSSTPDVKF